MLRNLTQLSFGSGPKSNRNTACPVRTKAIGSSLFTVASAVPESWCHTRHVIHSGPSVFFIIYEQFSTPARWLADQCGARLGTHGWFCSKSIFCWFSLELEANKGVPTRQRTCGDRRIPMRSPPWTRDCSTYPSLPTPSLPVRWVVNVRLNRECRPSAYVPVWGYEWGFHLVNLWS